MDVCLTMAKKGNEASEREENILLFMRVVHEWEQHCLWMRKREHDGLGARVLLRHNTI